MEKQRWFFSFALSMFFLLLCVVETLPIWAADQGSAFIKVTGPWQGSVFGDVGGQDKITAENFAITELDAHIVKLKSGNNRGKIASTAEGIAFYFQAVPAEVNFDLTAKVRVEAFDLNNQVSFGLMVRDQVYYNEAVKEGLGNYLALGPVDAAKEPAKTVFFRTDSLVKLGDLSVEPKPAAGQEYDLRLRKAGQTYELTFGQEVPVVIEDVSFFSGETLFVGLFTARNTTVVFTDYELRVDHRKVDRLEIDVTALKQEYLLGEELDLTGLVVTAVDADGKQETLAAGDYIVTGFDASQAGTNTLTLNYLGAIGRVKLEIKPLSCTKLELKHYPVQTTYYPGDPFDPEGLAVVGIYNDGYKREELTTEQYTLAISGAEHSGDTYIFTTAGEKTVTVTAAENPAVQTSFTVFVHDATLTRLEIRQAPKKQLYFLGEEFDPAGLVLYAKYSNGNEVRLMPTAYTISPLDSTTVGTKEVAIAHKGQQAFLGLRVKAKEVVGVEITGYPRTTYYVGEALDLTGLEIAKVYDNGEQGVIPSAGYWVDTAGFDTAKVGTGALRLVPADLTLKPVTMPVTVREKPGHHWKSVIFGQSTSAQRNYVEVKEDGVIKLTALEGGGKVATDHDGITFYYTVIDAVKDNFSLSADIRVLAYAKNPHDGQEAFGLMARDAIGNDGESGVFAANMVGVGGFSGGTRNPNGTQLFMRTGVESPDGTGSQGIRSIMIKAEKPEEKKTSPAVSYRLTLAKTNSGFTGKLNDGEEVIFFEPELLNVQDGRFYVGFFTARLATIEVSNIELTVTAAATDAPRVQPPAQPVTPTLKFFSLEQTADPAYPLLVGANVNGSVTIKQGVKVIAEDRLVTAGETLVVPAVLEPNHQTTFTAVFRPDETQSLTSYERLISHFTVTMRTYAEGGDLFVSPTGTSAGLGTMESPLDLDTAVAFAGAGQRIILLDGVYARETKLEIKKHNNGRADRLKALFAAAGAHPVIDFGKKSEGVLLSGDYWHVRGIDFTRSAGNTKGFTVGGNHNIIENCRFYENGDTGLQISRIDVTAPAPEWPSNNLILNCTSFANRDPAENNADGFAAKLTVGDGNVFRGCIAYNNIDDGWDLYTKAGLGAIGPVLVEDCIAYHNGFLLDGTVGKGDKNGFKLGGEGISVPHLIRNCWAFGNGADGFTANSNPGVILINNIAYDNGRNLNLALYPGTVANFQLDGFISYQRTKQERDICPEELHAERNYLFDGTRSQNSLGLSLTAANFVSLEPEIPFARDKGGNIIRGDFLKWISPLR